MLFGCKSASVDNSTVSEFDTQRFLGKWYEIARFDHRFERGMTHCTATYTMKSANKIEVRNQGKKRDGKNKESVGRAKLTNTTGLLRVSFFWPFYSDYRILMIAEDYSYTLIGSGSDDYLWIMSRKPTLTQAKKDMVLKEAQRRGYDISRLIWVKQ